MVKYIIGIDEVGRGPLAGPLCVCALQIKTKDILLLKKKYKKIKGKDSKKIKENDRIVWKKEIDKDKNSGLIKYSIFYVNNKTIDKRGMSYALYYAVEKVLEKINIKQKETKVLLDGSLKAPVKYNQKTIIKGDEKEISISLASIVAKVSRDKVMTNLSNKYPLYKFYKHKGYGTLEHRKAIKKYGITSIHRKSFLKANVDKKI